MLGGRETLNCRKYQFDLWQQCSNGLAESARARGWDWACGERRVLPWALFRRRFRASDQLGRRSYEQGGHPTYAHIWPEERTAECG